MDRVNALSANTPPRNIVVLAGGVGGAKYLLGVREYAREHGAEVTAIVNTGDDATMHGLRICPDLDSIMYTLGGGHDQERGWGQVGETWTVGEELKEYGAGPTWFSLGDKDIATHLVRTQMLDAGYRLTEVTEALCARWQPNVRLLPMSDDRVETHVVCTLPDAEQPSAIHFQEWWVRYRTKVPTTGFVQVGAEQAAPSAEVLAALKEADLILLAPSNPVVSIGPILGVPGMREALRDAAAPVIGTAGLINGAPLRGMADVCLQVIGVEQTALAVADYLGARSADGVLDGWLVAPGDGGTLDAISVAEAPLLMSDAGATAQMVTAAVELAGQVR